MRLVFCGTPQFAVGTLQAVIAAGHQVELVVAQPDRASGRGLNVEYGPVKSLALAHGIEVVQPAKVKVNADFRARLEGIAPDAILVVAYGRIIPEWMLALPRLGCINLHGSLLPKYRGAAPIQWAVANGETITGVTTMRLDAGLDTGPMLLAQAEPIAPEETAANLFESLADIGANLMLRTLAGLEDGSVFPIEQNPAAASLAPILTREDGRIDCSRTARECIDRWRGFQPWPGAWTTSRGKKFIVHRMAFAPQASVADAPTTPGRLYVEGKRLMLQCADAAVELLEVQLEGKRRMSAADFLQGNQIATGEQVGE